MSCTLDVTSKINDNT